MERVIVFLDYQNVYYGARHAFFGGRGKSTLGNVDPWELGRLIASRRHDRLLTQVRVYCGIPDTDREPNAYRAAERRASAWTNGSARTGAKANDDVDVFDALLAEYPEAAFHELVHYELRTLRYPSEWPKKSPHEKGVDVQLAVDFVRGAVSRLFDVGIIMSADTDLKPAWEVVLGEDPIDTWPFMFPSKEYWEDDDLMDQFFESKALIHAASRPTVELAAWGKPGDYVSLSMPEKPALLPPRWLRSAPGESDPAEAESFRAAAVERRAHRPEPALFCHYLDRADYDKVADLTDYYAN
jgi:hypothetical protein